jgi:hypothetical protein
MESRGCGVWTPACAGTQPQSTLDAITPLAATTGLRSDSFVIGCSGRDGRSQQFRGSSDEPSPIVNIEFHQTFVAHFQKKGLANFLIRDIGAFHDLVDFERPLAERIQDILPIIQHDYSLQPSNPDVHS